MNYEKSYKEAIRRGERIIKSCIENDASNDVLVACVRQIFPELKEKPNGGIVSEDFNEGDGFYKVNLAYLSQEQVEEIERLVKKWNPEIKESKDEEIRKTLIDYLKERKSCESYGQYVLRYDHWIDWIEKQGKEKTTWSEDDELLLKDVLEFIETGWSWKGKSHLVYWLKSIKDKIIEYNKKQNKQKSMKVYRVENEAEQKGLWRKFDGTYQPLFDMLTDGQCKDLPMEDNPIYREGGKQWFASAPSKETLQKWFSKKDLEELVSKGFTISEFEVVGYKKVSDFEYIFTRDNIINRNYLEVSDIYPEQKD